MAINNVSDYFRSKLSHIWARFDFNRAPLFTGPQPFPPRGPVNRGFTGQDLHIFKYGRHSQSN